MASMIRHTILFFALTLVVCQLAFAQQSPSQSALERLVNAYRVDEAVALIAKDAVYEVSMQPGPYRSYYACVNRELTPEAFRTVAVQIAREQFSDARVVNQLSEFFESETGKSMRDYILSNLAKRSNRRASGQAAFQPGDYPFTKQEMADIEVFEGRNLYPEFQRFRAAINDVGRHRGMSEPMVKVQAICSSSR